METAIVACTTFFATVGPIDVAAVLAALTPTVSRCSRRAMAIRGTLISTVILLTFLQSGLLQAPVLRP